MAGSTVMVPVAQFAQQLKQKYPQYSSVPDDKLVAAFVAKNPWCKANYKDAVLVSVSYEPAAAAAPAQKPGVTASVLSPTASAAMNPASQATVVRPAPTPIPSAVAVMDPPETAVVKPAASDGASASGSEAQVAPVLGSPASQPYLGSTVIVNTATVPAPPMVGKYEIVDELGRGGMGLVYKGFDPGIGRTVALKVMSEQLARDTEFRERFLREARGAGILQHPNIVTIHELGEWQGAPFIAMEFLEGRSLEDILKNEKTTPLEKRLDIIAQVSRGLDYAHARGIVHRDIKPANVMVTSEGVAKVVDFGIARLADQKLTRVGHVMGTVSYMSPEQLQGKELDGRSDIFAVGVMLFEALTSVLPFAAEDTGSAITNTLYRQPPKLANFLANYPKELDEIISKCLAKDPAERFQKSGELADSLSKVQQELQRSQTAPTVVRSTPLPTSAGSQPLAAPRAVSPAVASQQLHEVASQSADMAKEWWRIASPKTRRNVITVAAVGVLYLIAIQLVSIPFAILAALALAAQASFVRDWWKPASGQVRAAVGVLSVVVVAFCVSKLSTGIMWYIGFSENHLMAIPVAATILVIVGANANLAKEWWKSVSTKVRAISGAVALLLIAFFVVPILTWRSTPKGYFDRGGEFEQKEHAAGRKTAYDNEPAREPIPGYPTFELIKTLAGPPSQPGTQEGAATFATAVAFSPDGNLIASGEWDGKLRIWDAASGQLIRTLDSKSNATALTFSPDGRWLASPKELWDVSSGELLRSFSGAGNLLAFDGHRLATTNGGNIVNVWDPATGKVLLTFDAQESVYSLGFIDGKYGAPNAPTFQRPIVLATGTNEGTVKMWDASSGKLLNTLSGHRGEVTCVVEDSESAAGYLATLGTDGWRIWGEAGGKVELSRIIEGGGSNLVFLQEGNWLASGGRDGKVRFWNIATGKELKPLQAHTGEVNSVAISPNGKWLATASSDKTVKIWSLIN